MKCKNVFGALTIALSMGIAADVSAFGLPKIGGSDKSAAASSTESMENVQAQQESLVKTYQSSLGDILSAQALLLEAHGKKKEAAELISTAEALRKGPADKDLVTRATEIGKKANETTNAIMKQQEVLTAEGRKKYLESVPHYAGGVAKMARLSPELQKFMKLATEQVKNASMMDKMKVKNKLGVGMYLGKEAPGYITSVMSTTEKLATYAKKQGVPEKTTAELMAAIGTL